MRKEEIKSKTTVYPALNIYMSPRVNNQKVTNKHMPLVRYTKQLTSDIRVYEDGKIPDRANLKPIKATDGMLYDLKNMSQQPGLGVGNIKILICICMYNEGAGAIQQTLEGIYQNLVYLEQQGIASEEIGVVCVQDGILKLVSNRKRRKLAMGKNSFVEFYKQMDRKEGKSNCELQKRLNLILDSIEGYQRIDLGSKVAKNNDFPPNIEKNISLVYQNLWNPQKTSGLLWDTNANNMHTDIKRNIKLFSAFKHTNGTKLSSHLLFFEGFCRYLKPQYCVLLDVGTKPSKKGLVNLIRGFYYNKNIGGCTGLMSIDSKFKSLQGDDGDDDQNSTKDNCFQTTCFSIQRAQQYEYILAHFLDKNAESATGFLHVLPGAWSAYKYEALIRTEKYEPNLLERSYFKMILNPQLQADGFQQANMYLAQDRILSLGIYCQMNSKYTLKYVPDAVAYTDPMKDHKNLMNQRRRWINSSLFAFLYVFDHYFYHVMQSSHNCWRKYVSLNVSMLMALLSFITSYFTPAIYWFILYVTIYQLDTAQQFVQGVAIIVSTIYVFLVFIAIAGSLMGKLWTQKAQYVSYSLSVMTIIMYGLVIYNIFFIYVDINSGQLDLTRFKVIAVIVLSIINVVSFIIVVGMHICTHPKFVFKLLADQISYIMYTGAYAQTMVIHGFCNVDDVSWGTKGATGGHGGQTRFYMEKFNFISSWLFYNCILAFIFLYIDVVVPQRQNSDGGQVLIAIAFYSTFIIFLKSILSIYNHFKWIFCQNCCAKIKVSPPNRIQKVKEYMKRTQEEYKQYPPHRTSR